MFGKSIKAPQGGLPIAGGIGVTTGEAHPTTSHSSSSDGVGDDDEEEEGVTTKKHKSK